MKLYLDVNQLPSQEKLEQWKNELQNVKYGMQANKVSLSMEERQKSRKMGPRRMSYAYSSEHKGGQYEQVMPRQFNPYQMTRTLAYHMEMARLKSYLQELTEIVDDNMVAAGIDAMTYTKVIHDALRTANRLDPSLDSALQELDEFNKRAQAEEEEEDAINSNNIVP